jgi:hypothetical protein
MSAVSLRLFSAVAAEEACHACFQSITTNGSCTPSVADLLDSQKYWNPATSTCGDQKNDLKESLIFNADDPENVQKNWILNPMHCDQEALVPDLAEAEQAWAFSQISYAGNYGGVLDIDTCLSERYSEIGHSITPSQATNLAWTVPTNVTMVQRPMDYEADSQISGNSKVKAGPVGAFWADHEDEFLFVWRGTADQSQLMDEILNVAREYLNPLKSSSFVPVNIGGTEVGEAFDYFYSIFLDLWSDDDFQDLKTRAKEAAAAGKPIKVIGHSLGGALAAIAAMYLVVEQEIPGDKIQLITFGEPRLSDSTFSVNLNTLIRHQFRYVYNRDLVPHVPPMKNIPGLFENFRYPQGARSAFHHAQEIFLQEDFWNTSNTEAFGKYHSCGYDDNVNEHNQICSNSVTNFSGLLDVFKLISTVQNDQQAIADHTTYWPQYTGICNVATTAAPVLV